MGNVTDARHGANGALCHEKIRQDLCHLGKALGGQLAHTGEETTICRVDVDTDKEERVHDMHPSILVNAYKCYALQAGDRHPPQRKMREEDMQSPAHALLRSARRPVLANGPGMLHEDCRQLGRDGPGPKHLRYRPQQPREAWVDHGEQRRGGGGR